MGEVFAAYDPELDRKVAIKLLHSHRSGDPQASDGSARLLREAQALARLSHANVITVFDVGTLGTRVFVAMEFVEGETLKDWMDAGQHPVDEVLERFEKAARGLQAAHAAGLVHRDFKPENVLLGSDGRVQVADFGLAFASGSGPETLPDRTRGPNLAEISTTSTGGNSLSSRLTVTGALMGTPAYMAPEQHLGEEVDARSDQFSFCIALYEALYSQRPFRGESMAALSLQVTQGNLQAPPKGSSVPGWLRRVVQRGLEKDPGARHTSMAALLAEIDGGRRRKRNLWALGVGTGVVAGLLGLVFVPGEDPAVSMCSVDDAEAEIREVWGPESRGQAQRSFDAFDSKWARDAWGNVAPRLDAYAGEWRDMRVDACESTHVRGAQSEHMLDLRMACLDRRHEAIANLVELVRESDPSVLQRSVDLVDGLPRVDRCADVSALAARVPPPEDPSVRTQVADIRRTLDRGTMLDNAGRIPDARTIAVGATERARALDYPPVLAEALILRAKTTMGEDEAQAEADLIEAVTAAMSGGDDATLARAAATLIRLVSSRQHRYDDADMWYGIGEAALTRLGGDEELHGSILANYGQTLANRGEHERARTLFNELLELNTRRYGPESTRAADAMRGLSVVAYRQHKTDEMAELNARALGIYKKHYGAGHPKLESTLNNLAVAYLERAEYDEAAKLFEELVTLREDAVGLDDIGTVDAKSNLGLTLTYLDEGERAAALLEEVARVYEARYGLANQGTAEALANLANAYQNLDRFVDADRTLDRAIEAVEGLGDEGSKLMLALLTASKCAIASEQGRHADAMRLCQAAHTSVLEADSKDQLATRSVILDLARAEVAAGEGKRARARVEPILEAVREHDGDEQLANALFVLAQANASKRGEREKALALAQEALTVLPSGAGRTARSRARIEAWMAKNGFEGP
jgi:tetratricopeptide (TPR) repeat protein